MADIQITCVNKPHRDSPHEHITHVGNGQSRQRWPREQVIQWIDSGAHTFYTMDGRQRADVRVVREAGKAPYLRTQADGRWTNNLLALEECPLY